MSTSKPKSVSSLLQLLPRAWLDRKYQFRKTNDKSSNRQLNPDLPLHEQLKNQAIYSIVSTIEPHFEIIHDLLIWKYPDQSIIAFLVINVFYWFIVFLSSHLVTAVAFIVFMYKVQDFWSTVVWPEIALEPPTPPSEQENWTCVDPNLLSAPEISRFVDSCISWVKHRLIAHWNLRSNNHLAFFLINLLIFTVLGWLGTIFSGSVIIWFILMATLLTPGINVHLFPFIKTSNQSEDNNVCKSEDQKSTECLKESSSEEVDKDEKMSTQLNNDTNKETNNEHNLDKASKLFGQLFENTKIYLNQILSDDKIEEPTEEFIKQKEVELSKAHEFLTDVVLNQDPTFPVDNIELNQSFKFIQEEFNKLHKLKESVKLNNPKASNSIESNLVPSYFENDSSPTLSSDGEDDFEIIN